MVDLWQPLAVLASVQFVDAALCWRPVPFVRDCLRDVAFAERYWWVLTPLKLAAAGGLVIGIWVPWMAALTSASLVAYFVVAIAMHVRARDFGRNLFVNATGMFVLSSAVLGVAVLEG